VRALFLTSTNGLRSRRGRNRGATGFNEESSARWEAAASSVVSAAPAERCMGFALGDRSQGLGRASNERSAVELTRRLSTEGCTRCVVRVLVMLVTFDVIHRRFLVPEGIRGSQYPPGIEGPV